MCVSRVQRLLTAFMLGVVMAIAILSDSKYLFEAFLLQSFIIIMIIIWAITDFCPSLWLLKKILPPCEWEK